MKSSEIELCLGKQLASKLLASQNELASRVTKMQTEIRKAIRVCCSRHQTFG